MPEKQKISFLSPMMEKYLKTSGTICSSLQQNELKAYNQTQTKAQAFNKFITEQ